MSGAFEVQKALYDALSTDSDVGSVTQDVYDYVPQGSIKDDSDFPYLVIGEDTAAPWDTDTWTGAEWTVTLHAWSRYRGQKEVKEIQDACYNLLHRLDLSVTGYNTVTVEWEFSETLMDPDGLTHHGVQQFRIRLQGV